MGWSHLTLPFRNETPQWMLLLRLLLHDQMPRPQMVALSQLHARVDDCRRRRLMASVHARCELAAIVTVDPE
jgi:hypothetical protein